MATAQVKVSSAGEAGRRCRRDRTHTHRATGATGIHWPNYDSGEPPVCSTNDGIPDEWKRTHGLSLDDPNVANAVNAEGYTELEMYLNSLVEH